MPECFFYGRVPWLYNQYWLGGFMVLWLFFYVQEHPKAQPAVVLVLKRLMFAFVIIESKFAVNCHHFIYFHK